MNLTQLPFRRSILTLAVTLACTGNIASAAIINVSGGCTLINAIKNANTDADTDGVGGCPKGAGADTINLAANKIYKLKKVDNDTTDTDGPNGLPSVSSIITINGKGSSIIRDTSPGTPQFRLFHVAAAGKLALNAITISNGFTNNYSQNYQAVTGSGAGLLNRGNAVLTSTEVSGNTAVVGSGGGIANTGTLTLVNSTVLSNRTTYYHASEYTGGGGILNTGDLTLRNSTVSGNYASGFDSYYSGDVGGKGGGILNFGKATLTNTTLSDNTAYFYGGGIFNRGTIRLTNSIISNNRNGANYGSDCDMRSATLDLRGINLIEDGSCGAPLSGSAQLGPLLDNGGLTPTHALLDTSPAIDAISSPLCSALADQRGVIRARQPATGNRCDIGAYERIEATPDSVSPTVLPVFNFFTAQIAQGGIVGTGEQPSADQRRSAALNQLIAAGNYRDHPAFKTLSCTQLKRLLKRIDWDNTPDLDDYVTGDKANRLAVKIITLRKAWDCP